MTDPLDREAVVHREVTRECDPAAFESTRERIEAGLEWAVGALVVDDEGRVLLVRQDGRWLLPGGKVKDGESHREALWREMREETGLDVDVGDPLAVLDWTVTDGDRTTGYRFAAYAAEADGRTVTDDPGTDGEGIDAVAWKADLPENTLEREMIAGLLEERVRRR